FSLRRPQNRSDPMYVFSDPRSQLKAKDGGEIVADKFGDIAIGRHYSEPPQDEDSLQKTWITRGESFLSAYSDAKAGAVFDAGEQKNEYVLLINNFGVEAEVSWNGAAKKVAGPLVTFIPPGVSDIKLLTDGVIVRFLTTAATELAE